MVGRVMSMGSELAVVAFFQGIEQVGGGMGFAVVFELLVAADLDHAAVFQLEAVLVFSRSAALTSTPWKAAGLKRKVVHPFRPFL